MSAFFCLAVYLVTVVFVFEVAGEARRIAVDFVRSAVLSPFEDALAGVVVSEMARDPGLHLPRTLSTSALRIKSRCSFWEKMNELPSRKLTAR